MIFGLDKEEALVPNNHLGWIVRIIKKTDCVYEFPFPGDGPNGHDMTLTFDFSELQHYTVDNHPNDRRLAVPRVIGRNLVHIKMVDRRTGKVEEGHTNNLDNPFLSSFLRGYPVPKSRLEAAATYFRTKYCKGRAF
jgi:hypothetical protein